MTYDDQALVEVLWYIYQFVSGEDDKQQEIMIVKFITSPQKLVSWPMTLRLAWSIDSSMLLHRQLQKHLTRNNHDQNSYL